MSGKLTPLAGLICDDVRLEADEAFSLMGVAHPVIATEFPTRRMINVVLMLRGDVKGKARITTNLIWKGEVKWSVVSELEVADVGGCSVVPIGMTMAGFDGPGELVLRVDSGDDHFYVANWQIRSSADETAP